MKTPEPELFRSGREFAAWIGLTPKDHWTAGKVRLGGITRAGDEGLRSVLVVGATTVIQHAQRGGRPSPWLTELLKRKSPKLAAVALANKTAHRLETDGYGGKLRRKSCARRAGRRSLNSPRNFSNKAARAMNYEGVFKSAPRRTARRGALPHLRRSRAAVRPLSERLPGSAEPPATTSCTATGLLRPAD